MNILPHKSWHVRTKKNIARVRKDEAQAAEEKKEEQRRILLAEQEARTEILRKRARETYDGRPEQTEPGSATIASTTSSSSHVNLFEDLESGPSKTSGTNKEHEKEAKDEREKYEKSIGYLTYLGQDTSEATGIKSWYQKTPARLDTNDLDESRSSKKKKIEEDPLRLFAAFSGIKKPEFKEREIQFKKEHDTSVIKNTINFHLDIKTVKKKLKRENEKDRSSRKKSKKEKRKKSKKGRRERSPEPREEKKPASTSIEKLRAERLAREQVEKAKTAALLAKVNGTPLPVEEKPKKEEPQLKQKYNTQFNPHLARQNYEDADPWNNQPWNRR